MFVQLYYAILSTLVEALSSFAAETGILFRHSDNRTYDLCIFKKNRAHTGRIVGTALAERNSRDADSEDNDDDYLDVAGMGKDERPHSAKDAMIDLGRTTLLGLVCDFVIAFKLLFFKKYITK